MRSWNDIFASDDIILVITGIYVLIVFSLLTLITDLHWVLGFIN